MYVRVKTSNNGTTRFVQIVQSIRKADKVTQKIVRHVGVAHSDEELEKLNILAHSIRIKLEAANQEFLFKPEDIISLGRQEKEYADADYIVNVKNLIEEARLISGIHDVYAKLFYSLGYDKVIKRKSLEEQVVHIFRDIVLARIANPASKAASVDMLEENFGITIDLDKVYRMMDRLDSPAIERLQAITYQNTANLLGSKINVIFFDATTIYFESFTEDSLKKNGYSKDKKFGQPQVLFALLVTDEGLPVDYRIFEGNKYEGHTLIPVLAEIKTKYDIGKVIFVADSAMMADYNTSFLDSSGFSYIVGARLKSLPKEIRYKILDGSNYTATEDGVSIAGFDYRGKRLIVSYSAKRAAKDAHDRETSISSIQKRLIKTKNPKDYLSSYGYKKYIKLDSQATLALDEDRVAADCAWDGLLGVITNDKGIAPQEVLGYYHNLYHVEAAFRVTKHDLAVRPVYHWKPARVSAHIAICFCAYALVKHLEYRVKLMYGKLSPEKIRRTLISVQTSILFDKQKKIRYGLPSKIGKDAKGIYKVLGIKRSITPYIIEKCKL